MLTSRLRSCTRALLVLAIAIGCGGDEPEPAFTTFGDACAAIPDCDAPRDVEPGPSERIFRVLLARDDAGAITIEQVETVDVSAGRGVPIGPLSGTHVLAALDAAGDPVDSQLVRFPEEIEYELAFGDFGRVSEPFTGATSAMAFVRAPAEAVELVLVAEGGEVVARAPAESTVESDAPGSRSEGLIWAAPPGACGHVVVIDGETDRREALGFAYDEDTRLVRPGPTQLAVVQAALHRMPPLLCHGIARIAFGEVSGHPELGGAVVTISTGDMMLINVATENGTTGRMPYMEAELARRPDARARLMRTLFHEAGHATEGLLNASSLRPDAFEGFWVSDARALADETIERVRLFVSLEDEWRRVHESFVPLGWATAYPCDGRVCNDAPGFRASTDWSAERTAEGGFMSRYGASSLPDDIADMVAWPATAALFRDAGIIDGARQTEDFGCQHLRSLDGGNVPGGVAALYTKLLFLKDVGLVAQEDVDACLGDVGLPIDTPGFDFWQDDTLRRSFRDGVEARFLLYDDGSKSFEARAEGMAAFDGTEYPATLRMELPLGSPPLTLDEIPYPRGVYVLGEGGNAVELRLEEQSFGDFDVTDGYVLVAEAARGRIAGSIFIRVAFRPRAGVPQTFDPPLVIRFLLEGSAGG